MNNRHPHYDIIVAWAEGKTIQSWCHGSRTWYDWTHGGVAPLFHPDGKFRVKPTTIRYRTYLLRTVGAERPYACGVTEAADKEDPEKWTQFVRWLGDWQEVEI